MFTGTFETEEQKTTKVTDSLINLFDKQIDVRQKIFINKEEYENFVNLFKDFINQETSKTGNHGNNSKTIEQFKTALDDLIKNYSNTNKEKDNVFSRTEQFEKLFKEYIKIIALKKQKKETATNLEGELSKFQEIYTSNRKDSSLISSHCSHFESSKKEFEVLNELIDQFMQDNEIEYKDFSLFKLKNSEEEFDNSDSLDSRIDQPNKKKEFYEVIKSLSCVIKPEILKSLIEKHSDGTMDSDKIEFLQFVLEYQEYENTSNNQQYEKTSYELPPGFFPMNQCGTTAAEDNDFLNIQEIFKDTTALLNEPHKQNQEEEKDNKYNEEKDKYDKLIQEIKQRLIQNSQSIFSNLKKENQKPTLSEETQVIFKIEPKQKKRFDISAIKKFFQNLCCKRKQKEKPKQFIIEQQEQDSVKQFMKQEQYCVEQSEKILKELFTQSKEENNLLKNEKKF